MGSVLSYRITDIGPTQATFENAFGINDEGDAVGRWEPARHQSNAFEYVRGATVDLGRPAGTRVAYALSINERRQAVGFAFGAPDQSDSHALLWEGTARTDLHSRVSFGGTASFATAIDDRGGITGDATTTGNVADHAFLLRGGALRDLGTLGGVYSSGNGLTSQGLVVGISSLPGENDYHAFSWRGAMKDLGTLGGTTSAANGVNREGLIVGFSTLPGETVQHAFAYYDGVMHDLHSASIGMNSIASGVNDEGDVVGEGMPSMSDTFAGNVAVLWHRGAAIDLNGRIADATWVLYRAAGINARGQIVGVGKHNGVVRAFILTPVDAERHSGDD